MKRYSMKTTTNLKTGVRTFFVDGRKVKPCFFDYIDILADRKECFLTTFDRDYQRDYHNVVVYLG